MFRAKCAFVCAVALLVTLSSEVRAADKLRLERLDLSKSPTAKMYLSYLDSDGRVITGRAKEEFKLILDSAEQGNASALTTFDQSGEPVNLVVVAQVSQAMLEANDEVKKGVKALANAVPPKSKVAVLGFSSDTKRLAELGPPADAESAANSLVTDTEYVEVHLLDAVRTAIDLLNAAPKEQRKLIVLFSDGIDVNMEKKAFLALGKRAQESGIVIDAIGYAPFEPARLRNLGELTKQSNGGERACKGPGDVTAEFNNLADEIRRQYVATFELALAGGDGKFHTFQTLIDSAGRSAYSNNIIRSVPPATHPVVGRKMEERRWGWWALGICGGLGFLVLIFWLIFRERDEVVAPVPLPAQSRAGPQRTMALDGMGGKGPVLGWIVATSGKMADKTFQLKPLRTVIGTGSDCDVLIDDPFMSSRHCEVRFENNNFRLVDLGSTNGILVNDKPVREHELVDNDLFKLGKTEFKFKSILS